MRRNGLTYWLRQGERLPSIDLRDAARKTFVSKADLRFRQRQDLTRDAFCALLQLLASLSDRPERARESQGLEMRR